MYVESHNVAKCGNVKQKEMALNIKVIYFTRGNHINKETEKQRL